MFDSNLIANSLALKVSYLVYFFLGHKSKKFCLWIIDLVAFNQLFALSTDTFLLDHDLTSLTISIMTGLFALMKTTRKKSLTFLVTNRDWLHTRLSLPTNQRLYRSMTTWAEKDLRWIFLAWLAFTRVTDLIAKVRTTV